MQKSAKVLVVLVATMALWAPAVRAADGFSSSADDGTWGTEIAAETGRAGRVLAVAASGGTVYLGGDFQAVSPPGSKDAAALVERKHLAAFSDSGKQLADWNPGADKEVRALLVAPDGRRVYAGGTFSRISGTTQSRLAALDPITGALDPAFAPPKPDAIVRALALSPDGTVLYVGGDFSTLTTADGTAEARPHLAALDAATGSLLPWLPPEDAGGRYYGQTGVKDKTRPGGVHAIVASADGTTVHVGGSFLSFGGRSGLVSLDAKTGQPTPWQTEIDRPVHGLTAGRDGHTFYAATGGTGGRLIAFRPHDNPEGTWEVKTDGDNMAVVETATGVYLIGHYDNIVQPESDCYQYCPEGVPRAHLSAFDHNGKILDWNPTANTPTGPYTAAVDDGHLYIAGEFTKINGVHRVGFAAFSAAL
jgi:hypothetical protein